jgi:hypothetical protein
MFGTHEPKLSPVNPAFIEQVQPILASIDQSRLKQDALNLNYPKIGDILHMQ